MSSQRGRERNLPERGRQNEGNQLSSSNTRVHPASRTTSSRASNNDVDEILSSFRSLNLRYPNSIQRQNPWPLNRTSQASSRILPEALAVVRSPVRPTISEEEIDQYIQRTVDNTTPLQFELVTKKEMCSNLESIVRRILPYAKLKIMGGVANTFALKNSDVDLCMVDTDSTFAFDVLKLNKLDAEFKRAGK